MWLRFWGAKASLTQKTRSIPLAGNPEIPERPRRTAGLRDRDGYGNLARERAAPRVRALGPGRGHAVPVDSVQQRQEERRPPLQDRGLYSARRSRQEIQSAPESADADVGRARDRPARVRQRRPSYQAKHSRRLRSVRPREAMVFTMNQKNSLQP